MSICRVSCIKNPLSSLFTRLFLFLSFVIHFNLTRPLSLSVHLTLIHSFTQPVWPWNQHSRDSNRRQSWRISPPSNYPQVPQGIRSSQQRTDEIGTPLLYKTINVSQWTKTVPTPPDTLLVFVRSMHHTLTFIVTGGFFIAYFAGLLPLSTSKQ